MTLLRFDLGSLCDAQVSELIFYKIQNFSKKQQNLHRKLHIDEI